MPVYYNEKHKIKFKRLRDGLVHSTWDGGFHLIPASKPIIVPTKPKISFIKLPRSNKHLDLTNIMYDKPIFESSEGTWDFYIDYEFMGSDKPPDYLSKSWFKTFNTLEDYFDGTLFDVELEDSPKKIYEGIIFVESYRPGKNMYPMITLSYDLTWNWLFSDDDKYRESIQ